jgi:intein/homing endonuclease
MDEIIVSEQDIIDTFSEKLRKNAIEYIKFKNGEDIQISKKRLREWLKGRKPFPIKTVEDLRDRSLLPLTKSNKKLPILARIVGALFGDGTLVLSSKDTSNLKIDFYSKDIDSLKAFSSDIKTVFGNDINCKISRRYQKNKYGSSRACRLGKASVCRLLACLGVPVGDKVSQPLVVPKWVLEGNKEVKINFLDGLLASEMRSPQPQKYSYLPQMLGLSMSKIEKLTVHHHEFLNSLKALFNSLQIETWNKILKGNRRIRKDGSVTYEWMIFLRNNRDNVVKFYNSFPLYYAKTKKEKLKRILLKDPHLILDSEKFIHAPRTKIFSQNGKKKTTVPSKVQKFLNIQVDGFVFLTFCDDKIVVSKDYGKFKIKLYKNSTICLPSPLVSLFKYSNYVRWYIQSQEVILKNDIV